MYFGISEGKGGLKHGSHSWLGMDIFWNCPIPENIHTSPTEGNIPHPSGNSN